MQTQPKAPAATQDYLSAVHEQLADLDPDARLDLVAPVEQRLLELPEAANTRDRIEELYGPPAALAGELRTAAGFPDAPADSSAKPPQTVTNWLGAQTSRRPLVYIVDYLRSLRPAWWALRGYLLFAAALAAASQGGYRLHTLAYYTQAFDRADPHLTWLWLLGPVAAIIASIVLGMLTPRLPRVLQVVVVLLNVVAVVALVAWPTWWMGPAFAFYSGLVA